MFSVFALAQRAKDGNKIVTTNNTIINEYTTLTIDANSADAQIQVQNSNLNTNNRFAAPLAAGDLIMIIQMQGASLSGSFFVGLNNTTFGLPNDSTWGSISNYNNCGNYELVEVLSVPNATTITLNCALQFDFDVSGKVQVVRIPRYADFSVNASVNVTCDTWNGTKGGIIAYEVNGNFTLNGTINADAKGFRGGEKENRSTFGLNQVASDTADAGAQKGEGIGGFKSDYNYLGGRFCKGAAANAGGGGDCHNAGGGGGSNGGDVSIYRAVGVPNISNSNFITAFNLEVAGFANTISSGGGRGGYSASTNNLSPLTNAPASTNWGGDNRLKNGGYGGRPLDYTTGKLFLGGGGGAGDMDDNYGGKGGNGGGLIYGIVFGDVLGTGTISSNGENGESTTAISAPLSGNRGQDGAGGAGAGGTIILHTYGTSTAIACRANGGNGGLQTLYAGAFNNNNQAQGPGGGGSGGFIRKNNNTIITSVLGGANGTTNSTSMQNFPCNGATKGAAGTIDVINNLPNIIALNDTICPGASTILNATTINIQNPILDWYDAPIGGNLLFTGNAFTTPILNANTDYYVSDCPLHFRKKVSVIMLTANTLNFNAGVNQQLCAQTTAQLNATIPATNASGIWTTSGTSNIANNILEISTVSNLSSGDNTFVWTVTSGCVVASDTVIIHVDAINNLANAGTNQQVCTNTANLAAIIVPTFIGSWQIISGTGNISNASSNNTTVTNLGQGTNKFTWTINSQNSCPSSVDTVEINVLASPTVADAGTNQAICTNTVSLNANNPTIGVGAWSVIAGTAIITNLNVNSTTATNLTVGTNKFVWSISNGICNVNTDTVTITVSNNLSASNAGNDIIVCGTNAQLNATTPAIGTGSWSTLNIAATIANANNSNSQITNLESGNNVFVWSVTGNNCPTNTDTIIVIVTLPPSAASAGTDFSVCSTTANLNANTPLIGNGNWTTLSSTATIQNTNSTTTLVSNLIVGVTQFVYTISNGSCPVSSDTVDVTVYEALNANAGLDKTVCSDTSRLNATPNATNLTTWETIGAGQVTNPSVFNSIVTNLQVGSNLFVFKVSNANCASVFDTVNIFRVQPPSIANAGANKSVCKTEAQLQAISPVNGIGTWEIVSGSGNIKDVNNAISNVTNLGLGENVFEWTVSKSNCVSNSAMVSVTTYAADSTMKAMEDTTITPGDVATLYATGGSTYLWEPSNYLSCTNCATPLFNGVSDFVYKITITNANGCIVEDSLEIRTALTKFVEIADVFSPNANDMTNRELKIHNSGLKSLSFLVFDEWGQLVFEIKEGDNFDNTWDGKYKGVALNTATFNYVISARYLDNSTEFKKGKILLLR